MLFQKTFISGLGLSPFLYFLFGLCIVFPFLFVLLSNQIRYETYTLPILYLPVKQLQCR